LVLVFLQSKTFKVSFKYKFNTIKFEYEQQA
jgi:hypothetical protein